MRYTPAFEGFKEDIILQSRNTGNAFTFVVDAGGLQAVAEDGAVFFADPLTGSIMAQMDPVYIYDSFTGERTDEEPHDSYDNQLLCEPLTGGRYLITINAGRYSYIIHGIYTRDMGNRIFIYICCFYRIRFDQ